LRDDFTKRTKQILGARVGWRCSRPECRAITSGPRAEADQAVNVGVAAHICAASAGGPRFDSEMSREERSSVENGIWLCQTCATLIDVDVSRYTEEVLVEWKVRAESLAHSEIGHSAPPQSDAVQDAEEELKRTHKLRDKIVDAFLLPLENRRAMGWPSKPYNKFYVSEVIIRKIEHSTYPEVDPAQGISSWFKLETYDFYYNGIVLVLRAEPGVVDDMGQWSYLEKDETVDELVFTKCNIWRLGRIPWRNIRHYDLQGDEYYRCPHLYCTYADDGMPYEDFVGAIIGEDFDRPLHSEDEFIYPNYPGGKDFM
jgi:hypothetical protein